MKKTLLACALIVSSCFFASAQFQIGDTNVNVGRICKDIDGKPFCINPMTGQFQAATGDGNSIGGNINTGQIGGTGSIGGIRIGGSWNIFGNGAGNGTGNYMSGSGQNFSGILGLLALAQTLVARFVPLLVGVALLAFFWFLIEFIWKGKESADEQAKGKKGMMYSILAIFVMVSIWGIIAFIGGILGISPGGTMSGFKLPGER